ncbi:MBL fold metallo-hydrolase [Neptunomonas japonica]|uniref:Beta-lactamase domain-containing protein n=1 Tax=Neptunomonas japonica JAMM 1380 TaxID=1441457 RepID=A0A7R6PTU3_9GAMM|nr:MBL fold metallo-hydrolase [Neptunomonas japonica]BBB30350.1 beta-lactamase domain-containing protein [Neptunomonas japonica JAMM 1380]
MKTLHKNNFYCWSVFDEDRNIDFHSYLWVRPQGNIVFDPLPQTEHDKQHLLSLGEISHILISNSDHVRDAQALAAKTGALICGPEAEKDSFPIECAQWMSAGSTLLDGLDIYSVSGSKTEGELAFVVEGDTLITGDLVRAHSGGALCILPDGKLQDKSQAVSSVKQLATISGITAVLPGDGWPIFRGGDVALAELVASLS